MRPPLLFTLILVAPAFGQVLDVNGDGVVGPHEALAVSENWKGSAPAQNAHNHLGQTWIGDRNPLIIFGSFPDRNIIIGPVKEGEKGVPTTGPRAPLMLENTEANKADLLLLGGIGLIGAQEAPSSSLVMRPNENFTIFVNQDNVGNPGAFNVRDHRGTLQFSVGETGNTTIYGNVNVNGTITADAYVTDSKRIGGDPEEGATEAASLSQSADTRRCGRAILDEAGEGVVEVAPLQDREFAAYGYQLTCVGGYAPVYVAERYDGKSFKIAGGVPGLEVSWEIHGIPE